MKKHIFKKNTHAASVCRVVSPERLENWGVNKKLFSIFQARRAENASAAKQARRASPLTAGEAGEPSRGGRELRPAQGTDTSHTVGLGGITNVDHPGWQTCAPRSASRSQRGSISHCVCDAPAEVGTARRRSHRPGASGDHIPEGRPYTVYTLQPGQRVGTSSSRSLVTHLAGRETPVRVSPVSVLMQLLHSSWGRRRRNAQGKTRCSQVQGSEW